MYVCNIYYVYNIKKYFSINLLSTDKINLSASHYKQTKKMFLVNKKKKSKWNSIFFCLDIINVYVMLLI